MGCRSHAGLLTCGGGVVRMVRACWDVERHTYLAEASSCGPAQALGSGPDQQLARQQEDIAEQGGTGFLANLRCPAMGQQGYKITGRRE